MSAPAVLVLAGLDPSGGAGLLADAETLRAMGARPLCVATALTVQTTRAARRFQPVDPSLIADAIRALLEEEDVRAIKVGMVGDAANARAIRALLPAGIPAVVDPVLAASSGVPLFSGPPRELLELARGAILTPNVAEAEALLGGSADAGKLLERGPLAVLLKGGHLAGEPVDVLATASGIEQFAAPRIPAEARGTGCRLASAIAAGLARGDPLRDAVIAARWHVREYLQERVPV
ncbi:MAG TPA: hydroxymethylpyrimidine/phosphomethylpyrimidine kinase [Myxococcales bacterium]|nr:hydroxymethylpyrimidine/phosphomethylpyrimidine kinase [Myxococcales bacterium]